MANFNRIPSNFPLVVLASNVAECALKSENAIKLQSIFDEAIESIEDGLIIRFKIGDEPEFYADFSSGRGKYFITVGCRSLNTLSNQQIKFN